MTMDLLTNVAMMVIPTCFFDPTDIDGGGVTPKPKKRTSPTYSELIQAAKRQRLSEFFD